MTFFFLLSQKAVENSSRFRVPMAVPACWSVAPSNSSRVSSSRTCAHSYSSAKKLLFCVGPRQVTSVLSKSICLKSKQAAHAPFGSSYPKIVFAILC